MITHRAEIVIEAGRTEGNYWRDIWHYRELLYFLAWRDVLVRYKQTVIGIAWALLRPVLTVAAFTIVFNKVAGLGFAGAPQHAELPRDHRSIVDPVARKVRHIGNVVGRQQPGFVQPVEADQLRIAGEGREPLVGRVAVAGRAERHDLPQALAGGVQKIHKRICGVTELADTPPPRQRGRVQ